jgi:DNA-directed RNA polymerase subunit F
MDNKKIATGVAVGAGIAAAVAAVAGAYFLYGAKDAAKNRKKVKAWSLKAKGEILEKLEKLSDVSEEVYNKIVDEVSEKYKKVKNIDQEDIEKFGKELKSHWRKMERDVKKKFSGKK